MNPTRSPKQPPPAGAACRGPGAGPGIAGLALVALLGALPASAVDLSGNVRVSGGATDAGERTDLLEQQYAFTLFQRLSPYLALRLGTNLYDLGSESAGASFDRRTREPRVELLYQRRNLSALVSYLDRVSEGSSDADDYEVDSLIGRVTWRPSRGPSLSLRFRDETNVADASQLGRDTDTRSMAADVAWSRSLWSAGYTFERFDLDSRGSGAALRQDRHELRAQASRTFGDGLLRLALDTRASRIDRESRVPAGAGLAELVPAREGLFAIDTSPEVGELTAAPGLVDGDVVNPAAPGIDVGGANSFRNLGLDLGLARPVTALEVAVDRPSDASVVWRAYRSADNLLWEEVAGTTSRFEGDLLRYVVRLPETTERFFKVVNVTANAAVEVRVTEVRALRDVAEGPRASGQSDLYRADFSALLQPHRRVGLRLAAGASEDENVVGALTRRRLEESHADARLSLDLTDELRFTGGYGWLDYEDRVEPVLVRTENRWDASLSWTPLPTVEAVLSTARREESDEGALVRANETLRFRLTTELLPDLRLVSEVERSELEDGLGDLDRRVTSYHETLEARPTARWWLSGGLAFRRYETAAGDLLFEQTELRLQTNWAATPWLHLAGTWEVGEVDGDETLDQSYTLSYSPGDRLSLSATWQSYENVDRRSTTTTTASADYRLNPRFTLFGQTSRSQLDEGNAETAEFTSFRAGFGLIF